MGKPTGFLDVARQNNPCADPLVRIEHYQEFHPALSLDARQAQASRCMDCGVPFCQSGVQLGGLYTGCPLHNRIPEWNDLLYRGQFASAAKRLLTTNPFPEFTGRVCPALCEAACTCAQHGDAVTTRENELFLIEYAFEHGLMTPNPPASRTSRSVAVLGSGPSGLACAEMLNRRGHSVTVYERSEVPGGLLMNGIPNMKLDKRVVLRRIERMAASGICFKTGIEIADAAQAQALRSAFDAVVLCCGASAARDLRVPGREAEGVSLAVPYLTEATRAFRTGVPAALTARGKHVVVVGGGDTGNDCVGTAIRQGCLSVVQLEMMPKPPETRLVNNPWPQWPRVLKTDYGQQEAIAKFGQDPRVYQTTVKSLDVSEDGRLRSLQTVALIAERDAATGRTRLAEQPGSEQTLSAELLLIAAGFVGCDPRVANAFGVRLTDRQTVETSASYATSVQGVFTAGDMRRGQSLVVWAIAEGCGAAEAVDAYLRQG